MSKHEILYLTDDDVVAAGADMELAIDAVQKVLSLHDKGEVNLPSKVILDLDERKHGRINAMPAAIGGDVKMCGIKWIAGFPNNPVRYGLPRAHALTILNDPENGLPLCVMDGTRISALRTGAVTGVGARYLARSDSRAVGLVGAGVQARTQIAALKAVLPGISSVRVYDIRPEAAARFRDDCSAAGLSVIAVDSPEEAVRGADILVTVTVADEPIVKTAWLAEGVFFAHVGSYQEEEEQVIIDADKVVVDIWEEVLHRGTPLLARMFRVGKIDERRIHANIGEIINGIKPGRESEAERIFFSPLGLGSEDIAVAAAVYRKAREQNLGTRLPF